MPAKKKAKKKHTKPPPCPLCKCLEFPECVERDDQGDHVVCDECMNGANGGHYDMYRPESPSK